MKKKVLQVLAIILLLAILVGAFIIGFENGMKEARLEHEKTVLLQQQTDSIVNTTAEDN